VIDKNLVTDIQTAGGHNAFSDNQWLAEGQRQDGQAVSKGKEGTNRAVGLADLPTIMVSCVDR